MTKFILTSLFLVTLSFNTAQADNLDDIRLRVQKVGTLNIKDAAEKQGTGTATATITKVVTEEAPSSSAADYQAKCFACHGTGAAGAPKLGDKAAWAPRIANGIDVITQNAIKGVGGMPPRGGTTLDDNSMASIVEYMVNESQ